MADIKALDMLEARRKKPCRAVRAILSDAAADRSARVLANTEEVFAIEAGGIFYGVSDELSAIKKHIDDSECDRALAFCSKADGGAPAAAAYAYLGGMPPLPSGAFDIKKLAPTLAQVVSDGAGLDLPTADKLMRGNGVFGAIIDGKLVGFIGQSGTGGIDIFRVFDGAKTREIGTELVKFSTTLVMTGGRTPFAIVKTADEVRQQILADCGFTECELWVYAV